ncbi:hypothetical protein A6R68_08391 [Neotoma lepida]|uniref:Uncharacterized protein n=1 Tax=Neotoma lepida TaxID=56216 RepID=A0A1A6G540_NEOLE|nr:hypothetical protein A6R68_08391 [Neotoma lepida]
MHENGRQAQTLSLVGVCRHQPGTPPGVNPGQTNRDRERPAKVMNSNIENLPLHISHLMYKKMTLPTADLSDGIKTFLNEKDITNLQVTMKGPEGTLYDGSLFFMKLLMGKDFLPPHARTTS